MHSSIVYLHKAGAKIHSVGDWFRLAQPQKGIKQWEDGRSAKELAKRWFSEKGKPQVPNELIELLNSTQKLKGTVIREGIPEHRIKLDNFRGNTRNTDLVLMGKKGNRRISISIEAKADEYFDLLVSEKLNSVKNKPDS